MTTEPTIEEDRRATYTGLRMAMPVLVVLLGVAVALRFSTTCVQPSISASYYTPVRPVFVAALCAIGACLVLYRGSTSFENSVLNFSGFLAFVVAFEPTDIGAQACDVTNRPEDGEILSATHNSIWALYVAGALALVIGIGIARRRTSSSAGAWERAVSVGLVVLLGAGFVVFLASEEFFARWGHLVAASGLFVGIIVVVGYNAWRDRRRWPGRVYTVLAALMVLTPVLLAVDFGYQVLVVEAVLIALFAVYWLVQTAAIDGPGTSPVTPAAEDRPLAPV